MNQTETTNTTETLDPTKQQRAREYAHLSRVLMVLDLMMGAGIILVMLFGDVSLWLRTQISTITTNPFAVVALYAVIFGAVTTIIALPWSYYEGYILPHRYDLSVQTRREWLIDELKGMAIGSVLGIIVLEVVYFLLRVQPDTWWLWAAGATLLFSVLLSNLAPVLIFPLFYKFTPLEDEELRDRLTALAKRAGAKVRGVFTMDMSTKTKEANAALMGLGNTRRIVLGDTLYDRYTASEIETILAHELGHHVHHDLWWLIAVQTISTLISFYLANIVLRWGVAYFGFNNVGDIAAFPLFSLVLVIFGLLTMPLTNGFSRWREYLADEYALEMTRNPQAFISAMTKLANQNLAEVEPAAWVEFVLHGHPSINKRIRHAENFQLVR